MKQRDSNLELLRIVSMILIIIHHYAVHGFLLKEGFSIFPITLNKLIILFLSLGGEVGVNCFVLISSYYLIDNKIKLRKIFEIFSKVIFYSLVILILLYILKYNYLIIGGNIILIKELIKVILSPFKDYWFISCYILLYISSPILNKLIYQLSKNQFKFLISIMLLVFCCIRSLGINLFYSNYIWFILLYFISSYIKKEVLLSKIRKNNFFIGGITIFLVLILMSSILVMSKILEGKTEFSKILLFQIAPSNICIFLISILLFFYFLKLEIGRMELINYVATSMLGVYLLHDNNLGKHYIWNEIYKNMRFMNSKYLSLHVLFSIVSLFLSCVILDKLLNYIFNKYIIKLLESLLKKSEENLYICLKKILSVTEKYEK